MYSRELADPAAEGGKRTLSFGVSGKLWNGVLVMYDRQSGSLWTQLDGRALLGEHQGRRLEHVESVFTTWATWVDAHPDTLVLEKTGSSARLTQSNYADYFADPDDLFMDELAEGLGGIAPKEVVFGVFHGQESWAVEESVLLADPVRNAVVGKRPVAVLRSPNGFVSAVERRRGDRILILEALDGYDPREVVRDALTGAKVKIAELPRVRLDRAYWYAWSRSHPGSRVLAQ